MNISLVLTVHNRHPEVSKQVADSFLLAGNRVDEVVCVLDRPTEEVRTGAYAAWGGTPFKTRFIEIEGPPGWICPAKAWNRGYRAAMGDLLYCISSEVVQDAGNVELAKELAAGGNTVIFGACHNSVQTQLVVGAEPGLLASSKMPRPLGFIACLPRAAVLAIGGADEAFQDGLWFEDDDFYLRLWQSGLDFVWDDRIHGTHLDHERPDLMTDEGRDKVNINAALMLRKHGTRYPWPQLPKVVESSPGRLAWRHLG